MTGFVLEDFIINAAGRKVPTRLNGKPLLPYSGKEVPVPKYYAPMPVRYCPVGVRSKLAKSLDEAIINSGLRNGDCISFHHHLREGDNVLNLVLERIDALGFRDLSIYASAHFGVHKRIIEYVKKGVITGIEGSVNSEVGIAISRGEVSLKSPLVLRSHDGRVNAIAFGRKRINVAFIAASEADEYGNANGVNGPSAFGAFGYNQVDSMFADHVIIITDNLKHYPVRIRQISSLNADQVVHIEQPIGNPTRIATGSLQIREEGMPALLGKLITDVICASPYYRNRFSFQTGAGGAALLSTKYLRERMIKDGIKGSFIMGGITKFQVQMLNEGLVDRIMDTQTFDAEAVASIRDNPDHQDISTMLANSYGMACVSNMVDVVTLGALEVDLDFNINITTRSNTGYTQHGIGGHQPVAAGAKMSMAVTPLMSAGGSVMSITERVTTCATPGWSVDCVITEEGVAVNPKGRNPDLGSHLRKAGITVRSIEELHEMAKRRLNTYGENIIAPQFDKPMGYIEYRDGTVLDTLYTVANWQEIDAQVARIKKQYKNA